MSRSIVSGIVVLVASVVTTGCGASRATAPTGAALAARIGSGIAGPMTLGWKASCVGHACTISWDEPDFGARGAWLVAFPVVDGIDSDEQFRSVRHLSVRIADPSSRRVWVIACELTHKSADVISTTPIATYPSGMRQFCDETERTLTY